MKTLIQATYIIAHDGETHRILHVGKSFEGEVERKIDASRQDDLPGLAGDFSS